MTDVRVKPNFFIIGAAKAGTNTIHKVLSRSEDVFFSDPKEPNYFVTRDSEKEDWYYGLFKDAAEYPVRGEKTVSYSGYQTAEHVAARIAQECLMVRPPHGCVPSASRRRRCAQTPGARSHWQSGLERRCGYWDM